jgi:Niemann-Pick C1 protein
VSHGAGFAADSIHVAQEYLLCDDPDPNKRLQEAVARVGKAVFNGGVTTFMGMGVLSLGPGKAFYGFGTLFCYMVVLGIYHGLFLLPVVLSIFNPSSISAIMIKMPEAKTKATAGENGDGSSENNDHEANDTIQL